VHCARGASIWTWEGTTTTPFDMMVLDETGRFHIAIDAILAEHRAYVAAHFEDLPEIRDWTWPG